MRLVKVLLVILLVAAAPMGVYLLPGDEGGPTHPDRWDPDVQSLVDFVERERGLTFVLPVHVRFLDDEGFEQKVAGHARELPLAALQALGLVPGDVDFGTAIHEVQRVGSLAHYDAAEEELSVRGDELTPEVRARIVHELTHALQDQHFDLTQLEEHAPPGGRVALSALVEGDAGRIEEAYLAQLPEPERSSARASASGDRPELPDVVEHLLAFPHVFGPVLLDSLVVGGNAALDAAFAAPPVAEAQVLDPVRYPLAFVPSQVPEPPLPDEAKAVGEAGAFGQFTLFEVLASQLDHSRARSAVQGWTGDRYRLFELEDRACVAFTTRMADPAAAVRLERALQDWSLSTDAAVRRTARDVAVRACDPGGAVSPRTREPVAFDVLALRAELVHAGVQRGLALPRATCVADHVLRSLDDRAVTALVQDQGAPGAEQRLLAAGQRRCR